MEPARQDTPNRVRNGGGETGIGSCGPQGAVTPPVPRGARWKVCFSQSILCKALLLLRALIFHDQGKTHIVLASVKRTAAELGKFQRKLFKIDDHMGIGVAGLISDGRNLSRFMRNECLSHK